MIKVIRARRLITMNPEQPELRDGALLVENDRIAAVGSWESLRGHGIREDLGAVTIIPGLINAHTHLELSHLAGRIPHGLGFMQWADKLFSILRNDTFPSGCIAYAVQELVSKGTCAVVDIASRNGEATHGILRQHGMHALTMQEYAGKCRGEVFCPVLPDDWGCAVHALYSTESEYAVRINNWCLKHERLFTLHLAEVPGENDLFQSGDGDFADFLRHRRILPKKFVAPGCSAVSYAHELGLLHAKTLAVHCVHVDAHDAEQLHQTHATVCLCPRSNAWIHVGKPPVKLLLQHNVAFCLGTDSLASSQDLDLREELIALARLADGAMELRELLATATTIPAELLNLSHVLGSLEVGKLAKWAVLPDCLE